VGRWHTGCAKKGMSPQDKQALQLPHHKLIAWQVAAELLQLVARIRINVLASFTFRRNMNSPRAAKSRAGCCSVG